MVRKPSKTRTLVGKAKKKKSTAPTSNTKPTGKKVKIKEMTEDEKRDYNRQKQQALREKQRQGKEAELEEMSVQSDTDMNEKVKICDMAVEEKREYYRKKQQESRGRQKKDKDPESLNSIVQPDSNKEKLSEGKKAKVVKRKPTEDNEGKTNGTPRKKGKKDNKKPIVPELPERSSNCRIRVGLIDIFETESDATVLPVFKDNNAFFIQEKLKKQLSKAISAKPDLTHLSSFACQSKLESFEVFELDSNEDINENGSVAGNNVMDFFSNREKTVFHISEPMIPDGRAKVSTATEAHLRASYMSILIKCDQSQLQSVTFPILGNNVCKKTSIAIGIQTVFAYMHAVRDSCLELVYFATDDPDLYDEIGEFLLYFREFDLMHWGRDLFFEYENVLFDQLQSKKYYASVPGTDMVLRSTKVATCGNTKIHLEKAKEIHEQMSKITGVPFTKFLSFKESANKGRQLPRHFISNGYFGIVNCPNYLSIKFPIQNYCGSNTYLRRLWIASRFYMYGCNDVSGMTDIESIFENHEIRKNAFTRLKLIHQQIRKLWIYTEKYAPHRCSCDLSDDIHENLMVFTSKMSHYDPIFETWILHQRRVLYCSEANDIFEKSPTLIYGPSGTEIVKTKQEMTQRILSSAVAWDKWRKEFCAESNSNLKNVIDELGYRDDYKTLHELSTDTYDAFSLDNDIELGKYNEEWRQDLERLLDAEKALEGAVSQEKKELAVKNVEECESLLKFNHFNRHTKEDLRIEMMLRNRSFRFFWWMVNPEDDWEVEDDYGNIVTLSVEQFIQRTLSTVDIDVNTIQVPSDTELFDRNLSSPSLSEYPDPVDLGKRTVECPFCKALSFEGERIPKCCQKGAVWIHPPRRIPKELRVVFSNKFRKYHISVNAAFSMASISYNRLQQAAGGVQSMKINGLMSYHPSAVHPRQKDRPRYANFVVLEHGNEEIARMRFAAMIKSDGQHRELKEIFFDIQNILDKHNIFYHQFKSMIDLEKKFLENSDETEVNNGNLQFRIVNTSELDIADLQALPNHKGVYADLNRIGDGYITVAYSWNSVDSTVIPRGLTIYPKNPQQGFQLPISIFSDLCELLSYPTLFPYGEGGWGLKKYRRLNDKEPKPLYAERKKVHIEELKAQGKDPNEYYNDYQEDEYEVMSVDSDLRHLNLLDESCSNFKSVNISHREQMETDEVGVTVFGEEDVEMSMNDKDESMSNDKLFLSSSALEEEENLEPEELIESESYSFIDKSHQPIPMNSDDEDSTDKSTGSVSEFDAGDIEKEELDPSNLNLKDIIAHGILEDEQEYPIDGTIGQRPNYTMELRDGEMFPVLNRNERMVEIGPFANPFEFDDDQYDRGDQLVHHLEDDDLQPFSQNPDDENNDSHREEQIDVLESESLQNVQVLEKIDEDLEEDDDAVYYGDVHSAEDTEIGQRNDGVKVKNVGKRTHVSVAEYGTFIYQDRKDSDSYMHGESKIVGQLHRIDLALKMKEQRAAALTAHRVEFGRSANRSKIFEFTQKTVHKNLGAERNVGLLMTMPSTAPGSTKYQRELVMSAITMANRLGRPHVFLTFTGNPLWKEIKEETDRLNCEWADIPELVCSAFNTRFEMMLEDVLGKKMKKRNKKGKYDRAPGLYGEVKWFNYSIEFQQRGMPHVHLLICLKNEILTPAQVDEYVSAEIPEFPKPDDPQYHDKLRLHQLVVKHMVHSPCLGDSRSYCNANKKGNHARCGKGFPHPYADETALRNNEYPIYRRTSDRKAEVFNSQRKKVWAGSEWVVPHSPFLLMKYETHINVEIVSTIKSIKYIFKYIHKGADRVLLEAANNLKTRICAPDSMTLNGNVFVPFQMDPGKVQERKNQANKMMDDAGVSRKETDRLAINESHYMLDLAAMTACEASWKLASRKMHGSSHHVHRLYVHEEGNESFYIKRGLTTAKAEALLKEKTKGMMEAWYRENRRPRKLKNGKMTTDLTMPEMVQHYSFNLSTQEFTYRQNDWSDKTFGRIQAPPPYLLELVATRILAMNVTGPRNWEELRSFNGVVYDTCLEAARARRLMNGEKEWDDMINEMTTIANPVEIRRTFVSILVNCAPVDPLNLFTKYAEYMFENKRSWSDEQKLSHCLRHIEFLLKSQKLTLQHFELASLFNPDDLPVITKEIEYDNPDFDPMTETEHEDMGSVQLSKLNQKQRRFVDRALYLASQPRRSKMLFVTGPGGTGKTFCYDTIYHILKSKGRKVACVAHTGIAASLLPFGCTAHRTFSIPLDVSDRLVCRISIGTTEADPIKQIDVLIWDECSMTDRRIFDAVNLLFQEVFENDLPFGGVTVIMGGDFRQILPIVENVRGEGVLDFILKKGELWNKFETFELTENQRAISDPEFSKFVLEIGNGTNYVNEKRKLIVMPEKFVERGSEMDLVNWVFPDVNDVETTKHASVLTVDNKTALRINRTVLDKLNGEERVFVSEDTSCNNSGLTVDPEVFASQTPQGMPEHVLRLKKGAQVILLRNLSIKQGLCNGTRLTVENIDSDIIRCSVNNKLPNSPEVVHLHRIRMSPSGKGASSCGFVRLQYPIRLAYASTINKSQGQTLAKCGLLLNTPVFTHGMLYVAISRVKSADSFRLWHYKRHNSDDYYFGGGLLIRNVVYKQAFQ